MVRKINRSEHGKTKHPKKEQREKATKSKTKLKKQRQRQIIEIMKVLRKQRNWCITCAAGR